MSKLSTAPASGMRDLLPLDAARRDYAIGVVKNTFRLHGFRPVETPAMERLSTLQGKYGEEGEQLMYKVLMRGRKLDRARGAGPEAELADMGLRYDLTVPLARLVAEHQQEFLPVSRRYQIQPVYRAERPARGRYREFMQCDVDILGAESLDAEAEAIGAGAAALEALGFKARDAFAMRLNHRSVLSGLLDLARVPADLHATALVAVDKEDKIGHDGVRTELLQRGLSQDSVDRLTGYMGELANVGAWGETASRLEALFEGHDAGAKGVDALRRLARLLEEGPCRGRVRLDPFLARGMGYYTGPIYEVQFPDLASSGGGGGRYDELLGIFAGRRIPACGFSLGLERILLIMEEKGMFPAELGVAPLALAAQMDTDCGVYVHGLVQELRRSGIPTDLFPETGSLRRQFRYAEKHGIRYVLIAGSDEMAADQVSVRDLDAGAQETLAKSDVPAYLVKRMQQADVSRMRPPPAVS